MFKHKLTIDDSEQRQAIRSARVWSEPQALLVLTALDTVSQQQRQTITQKTTAFIEQLRRTQKPDLLSLFITEYNLSSEEGLALMTLVEAFLRVPDNPTRDKLFFDKIANKSWSKHFKTDKSSLINIATIALSVAELMVSHGHNRSIKERIRHALEILSRPGIRFSVNSVMRFFGTQFVFSENIDDAIKVSKKNQVLYSFDMLGEAAWTMDDANRYFLAYKNALIAIGKSNKADDITLANGISVKLSALYPKYDFRHKEGVLLDLVPRLLVLVGIAQQYNIAINIDAEEADKLDVSLDVIKAVALHIAQTQWQGFGVVVQAYQKRAPKVLDWLYDLSKECNIKMMCRLVKGAYWDSEIKAAQFLGDVDYPVFTKKINTDYSYLLCAQKLLEMRDRIYPQFASHNAHTLISICEMASTSKGFEVQRLHGMGEALHVSLAQQYNVLSKVYAPIGKHQDLLAYLMRRLLENGANSSFINHLFDKNIAAESLANDVIAEVKNNPMIAHPKISLPKDIFKSIRKNSASVMLSEQDRIDALYVKQLPWYEHQWYANSMTLGQVQHVNDARQVINPADFNDIVGEVIDIDESKLNGCVTSAKLAFEQQAVDTQLMLQALERAAGLFEYHQAELMVLLTRESGKILQDASDEVREAVDFLRYYANLARKIMPKKRQALGVFICISPWNFPLAIFTGQIAAALAAGNTVIAKPAENTPLIAYRATQLMHEAGIPIACLQLCLGKGSTVGNCLVSHQDIAGVAFTGSTQVARIIKHNLVHNANASARLIAETGGLNAMIVDSTALSEQVTRDVIESAFKSAGQRCSALRILLIQDDCYDKTLAMIKGAMLELKLDNPKYLATDCGPVIDKTAQVKLQNYLDKSANKIVASVENTQKNGYFLPPTIIELQHLDEISEEFFGPILHVVSYQNNHLMTVIDALNAKGFGLTFGLHSRIKIQIDQVSNKIHAGNVYINRNQVGAVVGSQPFGGSGLSGTGPKAGGPHALHGYSQSTGFKTVSHAILNHKTDVFNSKTCQQLQTLLPSIEPAFFDYLVDTINRYGAPEFLPGVTGETNQLRYQPKGWVLCLGPKPTDMLMQSLISLALGNRVMTLLSLHNYQALMDAGISQKFLTNLDTQPSLNLYQSNDYDAICFFGDVEAIERVIENHPKGIVTIMNSIFEPWQLVKEQVITTDTTASGGNANLLAL